MTDWLVGDREFSKVVANHLRLDLNLIEGLSIMDAHNCPDHLWHNDHVSKVRLDHLRLLLPSRRKLGFTEALQQGNGTAFESSLQASSCTAVYQGHKLLAGQFQQILQFHASVGKLAKCTLLAKFVDVNLGLWISNI